MARRLGVRETPSRGRHVSRNDVSKAALHPDEVAVSRRSSCGTTIGGLASSTLPGFVRFRWERW
jgi:hypothetical protein